MKTIIGKMLTDKSIIRFIVVGGCCTLIDFVIYILIADNIGVIIGKGISMCISMVANYFLNKFWSFSAKNTKTANELIRYVVAQAINICLNVSANAIIFNLSQMKMLAFILATGVAMIVNYLLQRFWVFKRENS